MAGVAALYLAVDPSAMPDQVHAAIVNNAAPGKITDLRGSPNRLLHSLFVGNPGPGNNPPLANFSSSVSGLSVSFTDTSTGSGGADNVTGTFTFNLSSEPLNGSWTLRVNDNASFHNNRIDIGRIDTRSITI